VGMGILQVVVTLAIIMLLVKPVGTYLTAVFDYGSGKNKLDRWFGWAEKPLYKLMGVKEEENMGWKGYLGAMLLANFIMLIILYAILRLQKYLPLNPDGIGNMPPAQAFNTAVSFITNTNWQSYSGETTLRFLISRASAM
jgi:K+-transporting ATPase ATPase A chain